MQISFQNAVRSDNVMTEPNKNKGAGELARRRAREDVFRVSLEGMWEVKRQQALMRLFHPQHRREEEPEGTPCGPEEHKIGCLTDNTVRGRFGDITPF